MHEDIFGLMGTIVNNQYRVDSVVGEGGFGVVYRGWHLSFECPIAIKCLKIPPHFTTEAKGQFFESFRKEGQLLNKLSNKHPSVVRVYDFGVTGTYAGTDAPYLVLE